MDYYSSESEVQQSSMSKSLSLNVDVLPQKCHKSKALSLQFHEQDSSSTQSTDQSYPEVGSAQSGQISFQHGYSFGSTFSRTAGNSMGSSDFTFPPPLLDHNQSLARVAFHFADPCYGGIVAAYGPQFQAYSIMPSNSDQIHHGTAPVRIPLPIDLTEEPIYVNSKQYHAILRRRECRAKLEAHNRLIKARKPYLHESRHLHALKRARGVGGRFLNTKKLQESKLTSSPNHGLNVSSSTCLNLSGNMPESKMHHHIHQVENYRDGASTTSCSESDVTYASNRNGIFQQQQELGFRLCSYPAHTGRNMQDYTADKGGGVNHCTICPHVM